MFSEVSADASTNLAADHVPAGKRVLSTGLSASIFTACLAVILLAIYMPVLTKQQHYFMSDHCYYFQPFTHYIGERLRNGEWPLWNPYLYCGMSQIAVPSPGVLYPPTWLFAVCDYSQGVAANMILHQLFAGLGAFLLVSSFGWGVGAAAACALAFSLCGYMFTLLTNYTLSANAAWLPMLLWSQRAIVQSSEANNKSKVYWLTLVSGVLLYLLVACGRPEISIPGVALLGLWILVHAKKAIKCGALPWQLAAAALGALLSAPVLLPVIEWIKISPRSSGLNLSQVFMWSTNWYDWLCLIAMRPFGDLQLLGAGMLRLVATRSLFLPYAPSNYVGPIAVTLALWGLLDRSWRWRWAVAALLAGTVVMCVGEYWPIAPWLVTHLPFLSVFRYPVKWIIFAILFISICAARGVYSFERLEIQRSSACVTWIGWTVGVMIAGALIYSGEIKNQLVINKLHLFPMAQLSLAHPLLWACAIGFGTCLLQWLTFKRVIDTSKATILVVAAIAINLIVCAVCTAQMTTHEDFFAHKQELVVQWQKACQKYPGNGRLASLMFDPLIMPPWYKGSTHPNYTSSFYQYSREVILPNMNIPAHVPETLGYEAAETKYYRQLYHDVIHQSAIAVQIRQDGDKKDIVGDLPLYRFCQATGTQFAATQQWKGRDDIHLLDPKYFSLVYENHTLNARLYRVIDTMPRAYFNQYWNWIDDQNDVSDEIIHASDTNFDPAFDLCVNRHDTTGSPVSNKEDPFAPQLPQAPATAPVQLEEQEIEPTALYPVTITTDKPEHVSLSVKTGAPGFVVLTDHFYPGWQALVDGVPRPIYNANVESRAVYIPRGSHLIEFNYEPESLKIGLLLCALGCVFAALLLACALAPWIWSAIKRMAGQ